jgi:hypothetical protein
MTAIALPRPQRLPAARRHADDGWERGAAPTPLFTRHMLGAIEVEREQRRQRKGRSGIDRVARRRPAARAFHPRLTAAAAGLTAGSTGSVRMERPDLDRWTDDRGSLVADRRAAPRFITISRAE